MNALAVTGHLSRACGSHKIALKMCTTDNSQLPQGRLQDVFVASILLGSFGKQKAVGILNPPFGNYENVIANAE